jgi:hypothetical protein
MQPKEKALQRFALLGLFCFYPFRKQAFFGLSTKKPCRFTARLFLCSGEW